jgi:hypothetical protein
MQFDGNLESWKAGNMKKTLDIPDDLLRTMKMQAVQEGRKFKDVAVEIFRRGLNRMEPFPDRAAPRRVKLPLIVAPQGAPEFTPNGQDIDRLLMEDEVKMNLLTS